MDCRGVGGARDVRPRIPSVLWSVWPARNPVAGKARELWKLIHADVETVLPGKVQMTLKAGDRLRVETPGGGGYGK